MKLQYLGEAIFFLGLAYSLFRWAARTSAEVHQGTPRMTQPEEDVLRRAASRGARRIRDEDVRRRGRHSDVNPPSAPPSLLR